MAWMASLAPRRLRDQAKVHVGLHLLVALGAPDGQKRGILMGCVTLEAVLFPMDP